MARLVTRACLVVWFACCSWPVGGQTQRPVTAGGLALLAGNLDAAAVEIVRQSLTSDDPLVRTVAARIAGTRGVIALRRDIDGALARESDPAVAAEQVRALLYLGGPAAALAILSRLDHAGPWPILAFFDWSARMQSGSVPDRLTRLAPLLGADVGSLTPAVAAALQRAPAEAERLLRAWLRVATPGSWRALIRSESIDLAPAGFAAGMIEALRSSDPAIREATVWAVVARLAQGRDVPAAVIEAVVEPVRTAPPAGDGLSWEVFGREIVARRHGVPTPDRSLWLMREADAHASDGALLSAFAEVGATERRVLRDVLGDSFSKDPDHVRAAYLEARGDDGAMRLVPELRPGVLRSVLEEAGCRTRGFLVFRATYGPDGRGTRAEIDPDGPKGCVNAERALAPLLIADLEYPPPEGIAEWIVVPLAQDFLDCLSDPSSATAVRPPIWAPEGSGWEGPRLTREVKPEYPLSLRRSDLIGVVLLEATVSRAGCVSGARVLRGNGTQFEFAALQALSQWRFKPARKQGRAEATTVLVEMGFAR